MNASSTHTVHEYRSYVFRIEYQADDPTYVVDFVDFPEIITGGDTLSEAFGNACEALDLHIESLQKLGRPIPARKHRIVVQAA
jgi:predicted RNase H-like HicB family nuclease